MRIPNINSGISSKTLKGNQSETIAVFLFWKETKMEEELYPKKMEEEDRY